MSRVSLIICALAPLAACGSSEPASPDAGAATSTLTFAPTGVPQLGAGYVYEGWLIDGSGPHTTGRFTVGTDGTPTPASFQVDAALAAGASQVVLTIEPATGDDPAPSSTHFLAGDLTGGSATLTVGAALGVDLSQAGGSYILATPSTASDTADDDQGIWWLVPGTTKTASLDLPTLPAGWKYEGWVIGGAGPVTTGTFTDPGAADADGTGPTAGVDPGPPFPGQDFIDPAMTLDDGTFAAAITIEPDPDDAPTPFAIHALVDPTIDAVAAPASQDMAPGTDLPTATVTIQ